MSNALPSVDVKELLGFLDICNANKADMVPMIYGRPGIGKSDILNQWMLKNNYAPLDIRLAYRNPDNVACIYYPDVTKREVIAFAPALIREVLELKAATGKDVCIFLDELTLAQLDVTNACLELLNDKRIAGFNLPAGTMMIAAGNRPEDTPAAMELSAPVQTRLDCVLFEPTMSDLAQHIRDTLPDTEFNSAAASWLETAEAKKIDEKPIGETLQNGASTTSVHFSRRGMYRALKICHPIVGAMPIQKAIAHKSTKLVFGAKIGHETVTKLKLHIDLMADTIPAAQVMKAPKTAKVPDTAAGTHAQLLSTLTHVLKSKKGDMDAFIEYAERCKPEHTRVWLARIGDTQKSAIGATVKGKRMMATVGADDDLQRFANEAKSA
jgi:hypothetical protein